MSNWPQAIIHLDADSFFASCEQALHPEYRGKPLITGKERGIVACPSYEAKKRGVERAMSLWEAKKLCPEAFIVPSDYETYSLFSKRMFSLLRRFTPQVEEYSIDEAFADLSGLRRFYRTSYEGIVFLIKQTIEKELGITVSVGLSLSKSLAKLASKRKKPAGFTVVSGRKIHSFLVDTPLNQIWGFGSNTTALLTKMGLKTALDFAQKPKYFAKKLLGKVGEDIWRELRGEYVYKVENAGKTSYQSISKVKTFTPPTSSYSFIYGQLIRNLESACIKARRYQLAAGVISIYLRFDNFDSSCLTFKPSYPSSQPIELASIVCPGFKKLFDDKKRYRATGIILSHLTSQRAIQPSLFDDPLTIIKISKTFEAIDKINSRFGKHTVHLAASLPANNYRFHQSDRGDIPLRQQRLLPGEGKRQRLNIPLMFVKV